MDCCIVKKAGSNVHSMAKSRTMRNRSKLKRSEKKKKVKKETKMGKSKVIFERFSCFVLLPTLFRFLSWCSYSDQASPVAYCTH